MNERDVSKQQPAIKMSRGVLTVTNHGIDDFFQHTNKPARGYGVYTLSCDSIVPTYLVQCRCDTTVFCPTLPKIRHSRLSPKT